MRHVLAAAVVVAVGLVGCGSDGGGKEVTTPTALDSAPSPTATPEGTFPLTGVPTDAPKEDQPIVAVKIENTAAARPQAGLEAADIVYEEIVEGGITRFNALFHSQLPSEVGPVRSGREIDVDILEGTGAILVYSGAREDVTALLAGADDIGLLPDSGPPVYTRAPDRPGSHDLMADLQLALSAGSELDDVSPVSRWLEFGAPPAGGVDEASFEIRMSGAAISGWEWDADAEVYRRLQNGEPHETTTDVQVGAANVVAVLTDVGPGGCCDTSGNRFTETRFVGEGDAVLWREGQRYDLQWHKPSVADHMELTDADGNAVALAPGPTWIHLAPLDAVPPASDGAEDGASPTAGPTG